MTHNAENDCTCPRTDGYRIRRKGCPAHTECLDSVGPIPKLEGATYTCAKPEGHALPHESPDGTWWEPESEGHPCGHATRTSGCGGCDPGAIEFVRHDGGPWTRVIPPGSDGAA